MLIATHTHAGVQLFTCSQSVSQSIHRISWKIHNHKHQRKKGNQRGFINRGIIWASALRCRRLRLSAAGAVLTPLKETDRPDIAIISRANSQQHYLLWCFFFFFFRQKRQLFWCLFISKNKSHVRSFHKILFEKDKKIWLWITQKAKPIR